MIDSNEVDKNLLRRCRLRAMPHVKLPYAVNSYMIGNNFGEIIGGNLMEFMFSKEQNNICYPTLFKSRREIESFLRVNDKKVSNIQSYCYTHRMGGRNA